MADLWCIYRLSDGALQSFGDDPASDEDLDRRGWAKKLLPEPNLRLEEWDPVSLLWVLRDVPVYGDMVTIILGDPRLAGLSLEQKRDLNDVLVENIPRDVRKVRVS